MLKNASLIIKVPKGEDIIICQITAKSREESVEIPITKKDFNKGKLRRDSYVRIDKITTINKSRIKYKIGELKDEKFSEIINYFCKYIKG